MFALKLNDWLNRFKQHFFTYSNGFYHLPFNIRTPEEQVNGFAKYPFVKHNKERQSLYASTPFCDGGFSYQKLEEGCWIIYSKTRFKANVAFDLVYDNPNEKSTTNEGYYILSLNSVTNQSFIDKSICDRQLCFSRYSWTFFKPTERNCDLNFKGSDNKYITLHFNEEWLQKNLAQNILFKEGKLDVFLASDEPYIAWPLTGNEEVLRNFKLFEEVMNLNGESQTVDFLNLKFCTINLIFDFFKLCKEERIIGNHFAIDYSDKFNINRVENYLSNHLLGKFPGIDFLAGKFQLSESKLKAEFKQFFGKPVFKYFQEQQMELAKQLLLENQALVKEISHKFGYENTSKFSAAFKKHHGILPSELQKHELNIAG